jgi:sulfopyruvate decarboxylase TPP-binding subunit
MLDGAALVRILHNAGVTDVTWLPDTELGKWDAALSGSDIRLIRVCREGEAVAVAAGLHIAGRRPLVMIQCTGLFEAGDALRNALHDLGLPLAFLVGVRSWLAYQKGQSSDSCARLTEPIVKAWSVPYCWLSADDMAGSLAEALARWESSRDALIMLMPE